MTAPASPARSPARLRRLLARISIRLLAFNLLLVFLPAAGLLYLNTYERQLLAAQESEMVQQGRLLGAALAAPEGIDPWYAEHLLLQLQRRHHSRLRVIDPNGFLIADSSQLRPLPDTPSPDEAPAAALPPFEVDEVAPPADAPPAVAAPPSEPASAKPASAADRGLLYRLGAAPFRLYRRIFRPPGGGSEVSDYYAGKERLLGNEVLAALAGRYGATTRLSGGQRSVTLYAAIPILWEKEVLGVALVSQSTLGILQMLYEVRVDIFEVVLASVAVAIVLSLLVSTTIARPLRRLRGEAMAIVDQRGRLQREFRGTERLDEIGDLSRALEDLTRRLRRHLDSAESFASDVSHEFKNPLAGIRTATEILAGANDPSDRVRFAAIAEREVARLERLLSAVREISYLDARLDREAVGPVELGGLLRGVAASCQKRVDHGVRVEVVEAGPAWVRAAEERLMQVFENLLDNAASFSPENGTVRVELSATVESVRVEIADQGPGVPLEHRERIFDRFFSFRERGGTGHHSGLGLPIARAIVEAYGGTLVLAPAGATGALFEVQLPRDAGAAEPK